MSIFYPQLVNVVGQGRKRFSSPTSKVVCVGRNYLDHAKELNNPVPKQPLLFMKSSNTLVDLETSITIPKNQGECHHELEIAILIGQSLKDASENEAIKSISGIGLALDLTLRDVQNSLKEKKHPWEKAKNFDGACPVSKFIDSDEFADLPHHLQTLEFQMSKNGQVVQKGNSKDMLFTISALISNISRHFSLYPGDIILTGTPAGVAALQEGDKLRFELQHQVLADCIVS